MRITKEIKEAIASSTVPVLLGNGASFPLAWRLYRTLGTVSLRLGARRRFFELFGIFCVFRRAANDARVLLEQLSDIFEEFDGYLLFLIPTDEPSRRLIETHRDFLVARFILSEPDEVLLHIPYLKG